MNQRLLAGSLAAGLITVATPALAAHSSRDGLIAYDVPTKAGGLGIAVAVPGQSPRLIPHLPAIAETPQWSPDGRWIAFAGGTASNCCQIYVVHPDGSGLRQLTHGPDGAFEPSWMPNGTQLLADRSTQNAPNTNGATDPIPVVGNYGSNNIDGQPLLGSIVTIALRTGATKTVVQGDQELQWPSWSRGLNAVVFAAGNRLAAPAVDSGISLFGSGLPAFYASDDVYSSRIESVHLDGSGLQVLAVGVTPSASPNGTQISYSGITEAGGLQQVHVMNNNGSNDHIVSSFGWAGVNATWTPDGHGLLVSAGTNHSAFGSDVHIVHIYIRTDATHNLAPAWSAFADQQP